MHPSTTTFSGSPAHQGNVELLVVSAAPLLRKLDMILPDDENRELLVHRMASLLPTFFFFFLFVGFFISDMVRTWPSLYEFQITVSTVNLATSASLPSDAQAIQIHEDGTVVFDTLRLPRSDRDLDSLSRHLLQIAPDFSSDSSLAVQPDPHAKHERVIEVLSAIRRAGIRRYHLL